MVLAYSQALAEDSLNESHPILQEVSDPDEINSLFDSISYDKVCVCMCVRVCVRVCESVEESKKGGWEKGMMPCTHYSSL